MLVVASLDEMFITTLLDRQAEAVVAEAYPSVFIHSLTYAPRGPVAIAMLLDLVIVVGDLCDTSTLVIAVTLELATGESYYGIPNTIRLLARTRSIETLLTIHIIHNI